MKAGAGSLFADFEKLGEKHQRRDDDGEDEKHLLDLLSSKRGNAAGALVALFEPVVNLC